MNQLQDNQNQELLITQDKLFRENLIGWLNNLIHLCNNAQNTSNPEKTKQIVDVIRDSLERTVKDLSSHEHRN